MHSYEVGVVFLPHRMVEIRTWRREVPLSMGGERAKEIHGREKRQEGESEPPEPTGAP